MRQYGHIMLKFEGVNAPKLPEIVRDKITINIIETLRWTLLKSKGFKRIQGLLSKQDKND